MNQVKLKNLLKALTPDTTNVDFSNFDNELLKLKQKLKEEVVVKTLEDVNVQLEKNRKRINFDPLTQAFDELKKNLEIKNSELVDLFNSKQKELSILVKQNVADNENKVRELKAEIDLLSSRKIEIPDFANQIQATELRLMKLIDLAQSTLEEQDKINDEELKKQIKAFEEAIKKVRAEMLSISSRGGSMNRQIFVGGSNPLTRYTDINIKAGANVTLTTVNNNTTKKVDVTIASTGGSGGTVRSINSISGDTTAGATAGTDYVYLCSGTLILTLPDATTNTNLYTIKNVGTGVVTVATTSSQTIDGALTIVMPVQYTAVDLISDTANWNVT